MWAIFNYEKFPEVYVDISGVIKNDEEFDNFINNWTNLYRNQKNFTFIFDTKNCGLVKIKYAIYMAFFIRKIKKEKIQYLEKSIIYIHNKFVLVLLRFIFSIEKPIAPVKLIYTDTSNIINNSVEIINP